MTEPIETLRQYNAWRRGADMEQPHPANIGAAIDAVIADADRYRLLRNYRPGLLLDMLTDNPNPNEGYAMQLDAELDGMLPPNAGGNAT